MVLRHRENSSSRHNEYLYNVLNIPLCLDFGLLVNPEDGGSMFLQNTGIQPQDYMAKCLTKYKENMPPAVLDNVCQPDLYTA
jgi:hypothetical protein